MAKVTVIKRTENNGVSLVKFLKEAIKKEGSGWELIGTFGGCERICFRPNNAGPSTSDAIAISSFPSHIRAEKKLVIPLKKLLKNYCGDVLIVMNEC